MKNEEATYQYCPEKHGNGMYFITDCCHNMMYSIDANVMKYHGCLCPKCLFKGKQVTLFLRGTEEANKVFKERKSKEK